MKILVINGPNLNLLGQRDKSHYGSFTLEDIENKIKNYFSNHNFEFFQSNVEGEIINQIQNAPAYFDGLIINPGGYAHTPVAIRDALEICKIPKIEVHLSNLSQRDTIRHTLITAPSCNGYISGFKDEGYLAAVFLIERLVDLKIS